MMKAKKVRIIGAGFSGLITAYFCVKNGLEVEIYEGGSSSGGIIASLKTDFGLIERAANTLKGTRLIKKVLQDLNVPLAERLPGAKRRYLWTAQGPSQWPFNFKNSLVVIQKVLSLMTGNKSLRPRPLEDLKSWSVRCFNPVITDSVILPAFQGVYGDHTENLSATLVVGKLFNQKRESGLMLAPEHGMGQLLIALTDFLQRSHCQFHFGAMRKCEDLDHPQVFCGPLHQLSQFCPDLNVGSLTMKEMTSVSLCYEKSSSDLDGFGVLYPAGSSGRTHGALGSVFNSSVFSNRSQHRLETWYFPGDVKLDQAREARDNYYPQSKEVSKFIAGEVFFHKKAFPAYDVNLERFLISKPQLPEGVHLMGNYLGEIGLSGIAERARKLVEERLCHGS